MTLLSAEQVKWVAHVSGIILDPKVKALFAAGIVEHYAIDKETTLSSAVEIKNLGLRLFAGSNYAKVRVAGLDILHRLFSSETNLVAVPEAADVLDVEGILVKHLYSYIGKATKRQGLLARV